MGSDMAARGAHPQEAGRGAQRPEAAPAPVTVCDQDPGGHEPGRGKQLGALPSQHKAGLWKSQEYTDTLLDEQIPEQRHSKMPKPRGVLSVQTAQKHNL